MHQHALNREQFVQAYREYMDSNSYTYQDWEPNAEWTRYSRGRSWWLYTLHGERALAVITELTGEVF